MKKILLTAGICLSAIFFVQAQQIDKKTAPSPTEQANKMLTKLTSVCNLTPDQVTKAKPIITDAVNQRVANRKQYGSDKEKLKAANQALLKETNTKLDAILNADQQKQLTAFEQERKAAKKNTGTSTTTN